MSQILNVISQLLSYGDSTGVSDNPKQRGFDWTRKINSVAISRPSSSEPVIPPGGSLVLFDGTRSTGLSSGTSVLEVALLSSQDSVYALRATTGPVTFRTARSVSGITGCVVTVNNNAMAVFDFIGATLTAVQVGDTMRVAGATLYDTGPFAFGALNSGLWVVIGVAGTKISAVRPTGETFSAGAETVVTVGSDVQFYSADGVQKGDKFVLGAPFSPASQRTYAVADVTPDEITFVSTMPIPEESSLTYVAGTLTVYSASKRLVYLEVDQEAAVRLNGDTSSSNIVSPIAAGDRTQIGWMHKWGDTWKCEVVNRSVNPLRLLAITGE
jgi:hypothetical protein